MRELDLIPADYRKARQTKRWLVQFALAYAGLLAALLVATIYVHQAISDESRVIEQLRLDKNALLQHRFQVQELTKTRNSLDKQLAVLRTLRTGPAVEVIFDAVDRALDSDIWFDSWRYSQAGEYVAPKAAASTTGSRLIVAAASGKVKARAWRTRTHMEISGDALDHTSLAGFVRRLSAEPLIHQVKILKTRADRRSAAQSVAFELAIVLEVEDTT